MVYRTTWKVVRLLDYYSASGLLLVSRVITHRLSYDFVSRTIFRSLLMLDRTIWKSYETHDYSYWLLTVDYTK